VFASYQTGTMCRKRPVLSAMVCECSPMGRSLITFANVHPKRFQHWFQRPIGVH